MFCANRVKINHEGCQRFLINTGHTSQPTVCCSRPERRCCAALAGTRGTDTWQVSL